MKIRITIKNSTTFQAENLDDATQKPWLCSYQLVSAFADNASKSHTLDNLMKLVALQYMAPRKFNKTTARQGYANAANEAIYTFG